MASLRNIQAVLNPEVEVFHLDWRHSSENLVAVAAFSFCNFLFEVSFCALLKRLCILYENGYASNRMGRVGASNNSGCLFSGDY